MNIYDFDGTLSPGNMQEFGYMKAIGADRFPHTVVFGGEDGDALITDAATVPFEKQTIPLEDVFDDYFRHKNQIKFERAK